MDDDQRSIRRPRAAQLHGQSGKARDALFAETRDAPASTLDQVRRGIGSKVASGRQFDQEVVAVAASDRPALGDEHVHDLGGLRPTLCKVARHEHLIEPAGLEVGHHRAQRHEVSVRIGDDSDLHPPTLQRVRSR